MLTERLQLLVSKEQRRRLEQEARRRGTSVASVVREAVEVHLGAPTREERLRAFERIRTARRGRRLTPEEIDRIVEEEREEGFEELLQRSRR